MDGFFSQESRLGMAITQDSAARLNRIVVKALLDQGVPAVTLAPSNSVVTDSRKTAFLSTQVLEEYLRKGLVPVVYGDVLVDQQQGCTIWSTDTVFANFAQELARKNWTIEKILHVTEAEGVWRNAAKEIYPLITADMCDEVRSHMVDVKGFDVTGGMWHKIESSLSLASLGIETRIFSGLRTNGIPEVFANNLSIGTRIV
jgi:isopentenyl phosphate kinase